MFAGGASDILKASNSLICMKMKKVRNVTKGEKTRQRLLEVSAALFAEHSYHGTRVSDIVSAAGVTQPSFYSYFKTKDEIYQLLLDKFDEELEELVVSMLIDASLPKEDVQKNITASFRKYLDFFTHHHHLTKISMFQPPQSDTTRNKLHKWIVRNMHLEQQRGFFSQEISVDVLAGCYLGILIQTLLEEPDVSELEAISHERGKFLYGGLTYKTAK